MAGKTKIGGTAYTIKGGKTKIGGTAYSIKKGKTKIGGTAYTISFEQAYTFTGNPTGYRDINRFTISNASRAYTAYNSTTYCTLKVSGRASNNEIHFTFDLSSIPDNATITGVTCTVRMRSTYANTTSQGNASVSFSVGTTRRSNHTVGEVDQAYHDYVLTDNDAWTVTDLKNIGLYVTAMTSILASSSTTYYVYIYGATLTVNYTA